MGFSMAKHVVLERLNKLVAKGYVVRWEELRAGYRPPSASARTRPDLIFGRENMDSNRVS